MDWLWALLDPVELPIPMRGNEKHLVSVEPDYEDVANPHEG